VDYDLIVLGGGAAGLGAARAAARRRAKTLLVSDGPPGGDCTFYGCVPSKTLIESARAGLPYPAAARRIRQAVAAVAATEDAVALRAEGIEVADGRAEFVGPGRIRVDGRVVAARRFVIATGSRPVVPPIPGLATVSYLTNETVFDLRQLPTSLAVLGGGASGCELAQAYTRLGSRVTVIEALDRLLPGEEPEASRVIAEVFAREGVDVRVGAGVAAVSNAGQGVRLDLAGGQVVEAQRLLVAAGRSPITDGMSLDVVGVRVDERGYVVTDDHLATTAPGVHAAGDVTGRLLLTHAAFAQGRIAAGNALSGARRRTRYRAHATPWVTFTEPEVARVGMTEADAARHRGRVAWLPMAEMDRAIAADGTDGFIKLLAGPRRLLRNAGGGRILGATIVAARAGEMIHEPALAMATGMFAGRLAASTHAYPTWCYGVQLAATQFFMPVAGRRARPADRA
jgi:pyruvate/2-oxoglutarate dehydrogenase complex dihydrolipoamide dehydrogenase (E3) component